MRRGGKGILIQDDQTGTLSTVNNQAVCYEPASAMEENWRESDVKNALRAEQSTSNHAVVYPEVSRTLSARHDSSPCVDRGQEFICYGICADASNSMKSSNPHSGVYVAETSRTLDNNCGNPACNQGGIAVVERSESK